MRVSLNSDIGDVFSAVINSDRKTGSRMSIVDVFTLNIFELMFNVVIIEKNQVCVKTKRLI